MTCSAGPATNELARGPSRFGNNAGRPAVQTGTHRSPAALLHRLSSILLLVTFLGLGTGGLSYLHDRQHEAEDAAEAADRRAAGLPVEHHHHDESNCPVHAQLHAPLIAGGWVPPPLASARLLAVLSTLRQPLVHRRPPARADCRDPPVARLA